jgi:RND superfamily putative drug exporter
VNFTMPGTEEQVETLVEQPLAAVAAARKVHPGVRIEQFGEASATKEIAAQDAEDGKQAHFISYGLMLIILLVAFGAFVAAGLPLVLGATAVVATVGLLGPVSQIHALAPDVAELVVIIGLAVGVDYAMFYSRRMMEETDRGRTTEAALEIAAATSGRAVLISGLTVMTAMAGLLFAGNPIFSAFGIGTTLVVAVTVLGSLTFLPASLSFLGEKGWLEKGRVPYITKRRHQSHGESRVWGAILTRVLKRPLVSALLAGSLLVALCIPALGLQFKEPGFAGYSRSQPVIQTYDRVQAAFPGGAVPALTVIKAADVTAAPVQAAIGQLHDQALATGQLSEPSSVEISPDKTVAVVALAVKGGGTDSASERSLAALRTMVVPATVGKLDGAEVAVTGLTAGSKDFVDVMRSHIPIVFLFVLSLAFILLLVMFRSIVVPIKAIVLNLLSVGSAYGVLVLVFQDGHGEKLLNFESVGGIAPWIPLFLFVILFGLSMDYHVFILSRVREAVDRGMSTDDAVAHGIKTTAGVVTSAALVMVAVFGAFALGSDQVVKQIGVGLAAAILIDATIIRAVLLPASMKLLGTRNWYLPKGLGWLPKFAHEPEVAPAPA